MKRSQTVVAALAAVLVSACAEDVIAPEPNVYEVEVTGERFRIALTGVAQIARAEELLATGAPSIVHGGIVRGDGGFNSPYSWHLVPESVTFPDLTTEVCSGRPQSDVEDDVDYWVDTVRYYCPWSATIVARVTP